MDANREKYDWGLKVPVVKKKGLFYTFSFQIKSCLGVAFGQNSVKG